MVIDSIRRRSAILPNPPREQKAQIVVNTRKSPLGGNKSLRSVIEDVGLDTDNFLRNQRLIPRVKPYPHDSIPHDMPTCPAPALRDGDDHGIQEPRRLARAARG